MAWMPANKIERESGTWFGASMQKYHKTTNFLNRNSWLIFFMAWSFFGQLLAAYTSFMMFHMCNIVAPAFHNHLSVYSCVCVLLLVFFILKLLYRCKAAQDAIYSILSFDKARAKESERPKRNENNWLNRIYRKWGGKTVVRKHKIICAVGECVWNGIFTVHRFAEERSVLELHEISYDKGL